MLEKGSESLGINLMLLSAKTDDHRKSWRTAEKCNSCRTVFFLLLAHTFVFLFFFFINLPLSLPSSWVFVLPQWEYDGISLPMPTVSQLPALSGLLLEGTCRWFPQQPAPNERVHVLGKARSRQYLQLDVWVSSRMQGNGKHGDWIKRHAYLLLSHSLLPLPLPTLLGPLT